MRLRCTWRNLELLGKFRDFLLERGRARNGFLEFAEVVQGAVGAFLLAAVVVQQPEYFHKKQLEIAIQRQLFAGQLRVDFLVNLLLQGLQVGKGDFGAEVGEDVHAS